MELTDFVALIGAATGVGALVLSTMNYRNARPRIFVKSTYSSSSNGREAIVIDIRNEGQFGIEIVGAGLAVCPRASTWSALVERYTPFRRKSITRRIDRRGVRYSKFATEILEDGTEADEQEFIEPGRHFAIEIPMTEAAGQTNGRQAWPYAEDIAGRTFLAETPAPVQYR